MLLLFETYNELDSYKGIKNKHLQNNGETCGSGIQNLEESYMIRLNVWGKKNIEKKIYGPLIKQEIRELEIIKKKHVGYL